MTWPNSRILTPRRHGWVTAGRKRHPGTAYHPWTGAERRPSGEEKRDSQLMTISERTRRAVVAVGCATALSLGLPAAASAAQPRPATSTASAVRFGAEATAFQNKIITSVMSRIPGGVRISASQVRWGDGVILEVRPSATTAFPVASAKPDSFESCNAGYFCASPDSYPSYWEAIPNEILHHGVYAFPWGECSPVVEPGCGLGIHAYANNTGQRVWLEQYPNSGNEFCITNHTYNLDFTNVNDLDYWIYLSNNPNAC